MKKFLSVLLAFVMILGVLPVISAETTETPSLLIDHMIEINEAMEEAGGDDVYSIKNVPVTLYNYDGLAWNKYYAQNKGNFFAFYGTVKGVDSRTGISPGWTQGSLEANGGGSVALMGIVEDNLDESGLPVMSQGQQVDLFSTTSITHEGKNAKEVYPDVDFQFVYNETTGYYTYNAALNHAQLSSDGKSIQLYKQSLAPTTTEKGDTHGDAGFYPFADINSAVGKNSSYTPLNWVQWADKLENEGYSLTDAEYALGDYKTNAANSNMELHYGIHVESDFYIPSGKTVGGEEMVYEFTGDDDLWVFIDGKLVLDIGGGHTYVSGSFNLTTGEVWIEKYTKLGESAGGNYTKSEEGAGFDYSYNDKGETVIDKTSFKELKYFDENLLALEDDQMHTMQIFYLERHAGVSNCRMRFNLPLVPSGSVVVSKNLENENSKELSVNPDTEYKFTLYKADGENDVLDGRTYTVLADYPYTVDGLTSLRTDANGGFTLKEGQYATFSGIDRFDSVYVVESAPTDGYVYKTTKVNGVDYSFGEDTQKIIMKEEGSINYKFVNIMETAPVTITKEVVGGSDGLIDPNQEFTFTLDFTKDILETAETPIVTTGNVESITDGGTFTLRQGESVTIPYVPVNMTYTIKETNPDMINNSFDAPKFNDVETTFGTDVSYTVVSATENADANKSVVTNQQRFDLKIAKTGISPLDHDSEGTIEETQSTIYRLTGNGIDMNVAIHGDGSVTIKDLPVAKNYKVEELTDWSWRYEVDGSATREVTVKQHEVTVNYANTRTNEFWLSGDNYEENWWGVINEKAE